MTDAQAACRRQQQDVVWTEVFVFNLLLHSDVSCPAPPQEVSKRGATARLYQTRKLVVSLSAC